MKAIASLALFASLSAMSEAVCSPSATHICITISGGSYYENRGQGPTKQSALELNANTRFEFEMEGPGFDSNPFAITSDNSGIASTVWVDGINGISPAMKEGDVLRFTPPERGPSKLYYASTMSIGMGAKITIPLACMPSKFHLCVFFNPGSPGYYLIDQGNGKVRTPKLVLTVDETYTFEMVGNSGLLSNHPMVLGTETGSPITTQYSVGVTGKYPGDKDGAEFNFTGSRTEPSDLFYGSNQVGVEAGSIYVDGACYSGPTHVCIGITQAGKFSADQVSQGDVKLIAGTKYTFETVESKDVALKFAQAPFMLTAGNTGIASIPLAIAEGVTGTNPCVASGDKLYFVANPTGVQEYYYQTNNVANLGGKIIIAGACVPSTNNICVTFDGLDYNLNQGDAEGARAHPTLVLMAGTSYTFEMAGDAFAQHPFALIFTDDDNAVTTNMMMTKDGVTGDSPADRDDARLVFTPSTEGLRSYYYQSTNAADKRIGGKLTILGTCISTETHICVTLKDGQYSVNQGPGPVVNGELNLRAGTNYTFEAVGNLFQTNAFALTTRETGGTSTPVMTALEGVTGANPMVGDGDLLVYTPLVNGPSVIYYQSLGVGSTNIGGKISIKGSCTPTRTTATPGGPMVAANICVSTVTVPGMGKKFVLTYLEPEPPFPSSGPIAQLTLQLEAGVAYTFEITGDLTDTPFGIATKETGMTGLADPFLTQNEGVSGKNPAMLDGDTLVFVAPRSGASQYYYGSTRNITVAGGGFGNGDMGGVIMTRYTCIPQELHFCVFHDSTGPNDPGTFFIDQGAGPVGKPEMKLNKAYAYTFTYAGPNLAYTFAIKYTKNGDAPLVVDTEGMIWTQDQESHVLNIPLMDLELPASVWPSKTTLYFGTNTCTAGTCPDVGNKISLLADVPIALMTNAPTGIPSKAPTLPPQVVPTMKPSLPYGFQAVSENTDISSNCTGNKPDYPLNPGGTSNMAELNDCLALCKNTIGCDTVNYDSAAEKCYMDTCTLKKCDKVMHKGFGSSLLYSMIDSGCEMTYTPPIDPDGPDGTQTSGMPGAAVAMIVIGLILMIAVVVFVLRGKRKKKLAKDTYAPMDDNSVQDVPMYARMDGV